MSLKSIWNKVTSPITHAAKSVKDHLVYITTKADDDVQRREICGFLGLTSLTFSFFMVTGAIGPASHAATPSVSEGQTQSQQAPESNGGATMEKIMGGVLGAAGLAHLGLAGKSHLNLRNKRKEQKPGA